MSCFFIKNSAALALFIFGSLHSSIISAVERGSICVAQSLAVPAVLTNLKNYDFAHIRSHLQNGASCQYSTILNAQAMTESLRSGSDILSAQAIAGLVSSKFLPAMQRQGYAFDEINGDDVIEIAKKIMPKDVYFMSCNIHETEGLIRRERGDDFHYSKNNGVTTAEYFSYMKSCMKVDQSKPHKHVFFSAPSSAQSGHAVLLTFIYRKQAKPLVVYMDSRGDDTLENEKTSDGRVYPGYVRKFLMDLDKA